MNINISMTYYTIDPFFTTGSSKDLPLEYKGVLEGLREDIIGGVYIYFNAPYTGSREMNYSNMGNIKKEKN